MGGRGRGGPISDNLSRSRRFHVILVCDSERGEGACSPRGGACASPSLACALLLLLLPPPRYCGLPPPHATQRAMLLLLDSFTLATSFLPRHLDLSTPDMPRGYPFQCFCFFCSPRCRGYCHLNAFFYNIHEFVYHFEFWFCFLFFNCYFDLGFFNVCYHYIFSFFLSSLIF